MNTNDTKNIKDTTLDIFQSNDIQLPLLMITVNAEMDKTGIDIKENDNQEEMDI